jgi:hypothetical protein
MYLCCKQFIYWLYKTARINLVVHVYQINEVSNMYGISIDPGTLCLIKRESQYRHWSNTDRTVDTK